MLSGPKSSWFEVLDDEDVPQLAVAMRTRGKSCELGGGAADAELSGRHGVGTTTKNDACGSTSSYSATVRLLVLCLLARTGCSELPGTRVLPCSTKGQRPSSVRRRGSTTDTCDRTEGPCAGVWTETVSCVDTTDQSLPTVPHFMAYVAGLQMPVSIPIYMYVTSEGASVRLRHGTNLRWHTCRGHKTRK